MGQKGMCLVVIVHRGLPSFSEAEHTQSDLVWSRGLGRHAEVSSRHAELRRQKKKKKILLDYTHEHTQTQIFTRNHHGFLHCHHLRRNLEKKHKRACILTTDFHNHQLGARLQGCPRLL